MSVFTTFKQALRVGRRIRTLGRVKPWSLNIESFSGGFSAEPSLTLLLTMVSRVLVISVFLHNVKVLVNLVDGVKKVDFSHLLGILYR